MTVSQRIVNWLHQCRRQATEDAVGGLLHISRRLSPERILSLGRGIGWLANWPLQLRLAANLRAAGITPTAAIVDRYFQIMGNWAGWSLAVYQRGFAGSGIGRRIHLDSSVRHLDEARARGKGVLLAAAHFFCHEMGAAAINLRHPIVALVRESKDHARQEIKDRWYRATGMEVVRRSRQASLMSDTLAYLRVLRTNKVLAITPDLPMPDDKGVPVCILGRDVVLPSGLIALSLRSGAPLVPCWGEWLPDRQGRPHEGLIRFDAPLEFASAGNREAIIHTGVQEYAGRFEDYLRRFPENWMFWLDKRWTRVWRRV